MTVNYWSFQHSDTDIACACMASNSDDTQPGKEVEDSQLTFQRPSDGAAESSFMEPDVSFLLLE
jgi:hypothetical protein